MSPTRGRIAPRNKQHVVIFPFMAKGHTIPLLHLSSALSLRGLKVTLLATKAAYPFLKEYLHLPNPNIHVLLLPFPSTPTIPPGCESTDSLPSPDLYLAFYRATKLLDGAFRKVLENMADSDDLPLCVISDNFLWWTRPICEEEFRVPRLGFSGMGVFSTSILSSFSMLQSPGDSSDGRFSVAGAPDRLRLKLSDMPTPFQHLDDTQDPFVEIAKVAPREELRSWGTVINSFAYMESDYVALLDALFRKGTRAWLVGPLSLYPCGPASSANSRALLAWLDGRPRGSVVYVAFGSQTEVPGEQLDEIAHGLTMSGWDFVWVVRSSTWTPKEEVARWLETSGDRGLLWREMAPQREVLGHEATGGFVSHCGWNSVLEGVSASVPILAWPMLGFTEQKLNAKYVVEEMGVGLRIHEGDDVGDVVRGEEVCAGVCELMEGEGGRKARERVKLLAEAATEAVREGGSSWETLDELLSQLRAVH